MTRKTMRPFIKPAQDLKTLAYHISYLNLLSFDDFFLMSFVTLKVHLKVKYDKICSNYDLKFPYDKSKM